MREDFGLSQQLVRSSRKDGRTLSLRQLLRVDERPKKDTELPPLLLLLFMVYMCLPFEPTRSCVGLTSSGNRICMRCQEVSALCLTALSGLVNARRSAFSSAQWHHPPSGANQIETKLTAACNERVADLRSGKCSTGGVDA